MSQRSDDIKELAIALCQVQAKLAPVGRDSTNPHYGHGYAGLSALWESCRPHLTEAGLAVIQTCSPRDDGKLELETMLVHKSGQWIAGSLVVAPVKEGPQPMGSAMTYARRYGLAAMLGISPEDDDGEAGQGRDKEAGRGNGGGGRQKRQLKDEGLGKCPKCGTFLRKVILKDGSGRWFMGCQGYPDCKYTKWPDKEGEAKPAPKAAPPAQRPAPAAPAAPEATVADLPKHGAVEEAEEMCPACGNHPADPWGRCPPPANQGEEQPQEQAPQEWRPQCCDRTMMPRAGLDGGPPFWQCPRCKKKKDMSEEERKRVGL